MKPRHTAALLLVGWYLLIPPVFSPMGEHHRSFNDLTAPLNKWDIWAKFDSQPSIPMKIRTATFSPYRRHGRWLTACHPRIPASDHSKKGRISARDSFRRQREVPALPKLPTPPCPNTRGTGKSDRRER